MLGIHGKDRGAAARGLAHDHEAGGHQGLLVRQGDGFPGTDGGERGPEPAETDHGSDDDVHRSVRHQVTGGIDAAVHLYAGSGKAFPYLRVFVRIADNGVLHTEFPGLLRQESGVAACREHLHLKTVRMLPDDVQGLCADGSGGSEYGDSSFFHGIRN